MAKIHAIYRYPIKGLSAEPLYCATLTPGDGLYTIENGRSGFDAAAPVYLSKAHFLMLMKNERLARLRTAFDQASYLLMNGSEPELQKPKRKKTTSKLPRRREK